MKMPVCLVLVAAVLCLAGSRAVGQTTAPSAPKAASAGALLGSASFKPSPDRPVGWRGDGTGRYPGATPPTAWERKRAGAGYTATGIVWATPLPNSAAATPIIVGDKVFLTAEPDDLVCLDKQTGKILWIRSNADFEGRSQEERQAEPIYAEKLAPLAEQLVKVNAEVVDALNAVSATALATAMPALPALAKKREIDKQIMNGQVAASKKKDGYGLYGAQGVFGFAGMTPVSDGKHVFVFYANGISACYDLAGKRMWISHDSGGGAEHGNFASPVLLANKFIVWGGFETRGYDADTGKVLWRNGGQGGNTYGSMFGFKVGEELVAAFQNGFFTRVKDGKAIWNKHVFSDETATPIVEGDMIYAAARTGQDSEFKAYKIPASTDSGELKPAFVFKTDWGGELPKENFATGVIASPLWVDGLVYRLTEGGGLIVNDAATGEQVYRKVLPMKPHTAYWDAAGAAASPALAGKYIYLMDNQGITVVIQPGREYKEVGKNLLEEIETPNWKAPGGKSQSQMLASPVFEGARLYYRSPGYLYCIGEK